jgi:molecular chaperone DnaJ
MADNYYDILGVSKTASVDEIKRSYRKLAQKYHPDRTKGDKSAEEKFKKINQAYETLSDPQKKTNYDQFGEAGANFGAGGYGADFGGGYQGQGFDFSSFSQSFGGSGFSDIFETFFGAGGVRKTEKRKRTRRGNDIETELKISFEEAVFGCEKEIALNLLEVCPHCKGNGAEPGTPIVTCDYCNGAGEVSSVRNTILGQVRTTRTCEECGGEGKKPKQKCTVCHGTLRVRKTQKINIAIPAGIEDGSTIRLSKKGDAGIMGGDVGDLYVNIYVKTSRKFIRDGSDIHTEEKINLVQAVLGDEVKIETVYGDVSLKIPPGTQSGQVFKIKDKGIKKLKSDEKGDQYVKIIAQIPKKLNKKEKELFFEIAKEQGINVNPPKEGFFGKFM